MLILLDCDGVMASFTGGILKFVNTNFKARPDYADLTDADIRQWNCSTALGLTTEEDALLVAHIKSEGFCYGLDVIPGTLEALAELRRFADVVCVTSPYPSKHWEWERRQWLYNKLGFNSKTVVMADNKSLVKGDILLDDKGETIKNWNNGGAVLLDQPWNRADGWEGAKISNWSEFLTLVRYVDASLNWIEGWRAYLEKA